MEVVSSNEPEELARREALALVEACLIEFTANLLRVTRGAGRAYMIRQQADDLVDAFTHYWEVCGQWPSPDDLADVLTSRVYRRATGDTEDAQQEHAIDLIVAGTLQVTASRLLRQLTQEYAGKRELNDGVSGLEASRDRVRKAWAKNVRSPVTAKRKAKPRSTAGKFKPRG